MPIQWALFDSRVGGGFREIEGSGEEGFAVALTDLAERSVDGFFDEVAVVVVGSVDEGEEGEEGGVGFFFGVRAEGGE